MQNSNLPNIAWIVVDSVRSYSGVNDSRDFLEIFYDLSNLGSRYFNVQTSAPSTIMSTTAMLSGVDSVMHSLTYDEFDATKNEISYLKDFIAPLGYHSYLITFFPEGFAFLTEVFDGLTSRESTKSPSEKRFWKNNEITNVLEDLIKKNIIKQPFLLYLNYNCRNDFYTGLEVKKGIDIIKENFKEREIYFILNSDHGYPDPSKKLKDSIPLQGHDLVMIEDNITTPLIIIGNGFKPKTRIFQRVSLLDISQLIKSLVSKKLKSSKLYKLSNSKFINNTICTTWNRYIAQKNGKVCAVKDNIKVVFDIDKKKYSFYKTKNINDKNKWQLSEKVLTLQEIDLYSNDIYILKNHIRNKIKKLEFFFRKKMEKNFLHNWQFCKNEYIFLIGDFTPLYKKVIENINFKNKKIVCLNFSNLVSKKEIESFYNLKNRSLFVYIVYGVSITRWIREILKSFLKGYNIFLFTNYNLDKPKSILFLINYLRILPNQITKSIKSWGVKNTVQIILKKF